MSGKRVEIKYQYFEVCCIDEQKKTDMLYDLSKWIDRIETIPLQDRIKEVSGIKGRVENIDHEFDNQYRTLNFMRLEELSNTYKVKEGSAAEHIDLDTDEYLGKNTVVLYDPRYHVLMVQCGRNAYGTVAIESYINSFSAASDACYLRPIDNAFSMNMLDENRILRLDVRFSNIRQFVANNSRHLESFIDLCNEMESLTAHLELGLGYNRSASLDSETISAVIKDIKDGRNKSNVSSAKLTLNDDQKSSIFDLFENIINDKITYTVPPRGELSYHYMSGRMAERYDGITRAQIVNILRNQ